MVTRARSACGFTLIELLVCIAIVLVLALILFPVFAGTGGCGPGCGGGLTKLGGAMAMYMQDYDGTYPAGGDVGDQGGAGSWKQHARSGIYSRRSSRWVVQLLPYVGYSWVFSCRQDVCRGRNKASTSVLVSGSETPFQVSYGPNRLFVDPAVYGWKKRSLSTMNVEQPARKYLLADCATAHGFDMETIAYLRYPNYDPSEPQNNWTPEQYQAAGRVAWPEKVAKPMTRHLLESNILFADGHARRLRHDQIPNNDGQRGRQYQALVKAMVPWQ